MKKVLSILLAVLMLASLCTVAITSVSAEEVTINDLGVTDGSYTDVYDDPTGSGDKVLKMYAGKNSRPNYELADPTTGEAFKPVAGTVYTVKFDYYFGPATNNGSFSLYYGMQSEYSSKFSKVQITSTGFGFSSRFYGDSKWHTRTMTFTAEAKTGKVDGVEDQPLEKLYLTYFSADREGCVIDGYIKNIEIITETGDISYRSGTYNFDWLFTEEGKADTQYFTDAKYETSKMTDSFVNEDGETVFVVTDTGADLEVTKGTQKYHVGDNVIVATKTVSSEDGSVTISPLINRKDDYYTFAIKYKVLKLGANGKASIGFGRDSTTAGNCLYQYSMEQTSVSSEWQYFYATYQMTATGSGAPITIALGGPGAHIALDSIQVISVTKANENTGAYVFNDNGEISVAYGYAGASITKAGANAENIAMGEELIGWSTTSTCDEVIDKYPTAPAVKANSMLYAKYPTTIVSFNNIKSIVKQWDHNANVSATLSAGSVTVSSKANMALMVPAYDAPATATDGRGYDYYQFANGAHYRVTVELSGIKQNVEGGTSGITLMGATAAGNKGSRDQGVEHAATPAFKVTESSEATATVLYDFTRKAGSNGWETCGMGLRSGASTANYKFTVEKIYITDMSLVEDFEKELVAEGSIRGEKKAEDNNGVYQSAGVRFKGRVSTEFRAKATEIGFIAVPTAALGDKTIEEYAAVDGNVAASAKVVADGMEDIIYYEGADAYGRDYIDYQLIIVGLTVDGSEDHLLDTEITCIMYAVVDGVTVYTNTQSYCYNDLANK